MRSLSHFLQSQFRDVKNNLKHHLNGLFQAAKTFREGFFPVKEMTWDFRHLRLCGDDQKGIPLSHRWPCILDKGQQLCPASQDARVWCRHIPAA